MCVEPTPSMQAWNNGGRSVRRAVAPMNTTRSVACDEGAVEEPHAGAKAINAATNSSVRVRIQRAYPRWRCAGRSVSSKYEVRSGAQWGAPGKPRRRDQPPFVL